MSVWEWKSAGVACYNLNISASQARPKGFSEMRIDFDCGEPLDSLEQKIRGQTRARPELQDVRAKVDAAERPRNSLADGLLPAGGTAIPMMKTIHARLDTLAEEIEVRLSIAVLARIRYCDNECRKSVRERLLTNLETSARKSCRSRTTTPPGMSSRFISTIEIKLSLPLEAL